LRFCIRPLRGADHSWPSMDIRARPISFSDRPSKGQSGHQITDATAIPFSIYSNPTRRPRQCLILSAPMPASIPIRHGGTFARRDKILTRATLSRSTIPPRASRPTGCSVFLPGSIPKVTTAVLDLRGMALCSFCWIAPQACSLAGQSHRSGPQMPTCAPAEYLTETEVERLLRATNGNR